MKDNLPEFVYNLLLYEEYEPDLEFVKKDKVEVTDGVFYEGQWNSATN